MSHPFFLIFAKCQTIKQFLPALIICLERRDKKRLTESSWTTQKHIFRTITQEIDNIPCLIYVHIITLSYIRESLHSYWVFSYLFHSHITLDGAKLRIKYQIRK